MVQDVSIETIRVIGTLTPRLRCKLNAVQLNVMELRAIKSPIASLHAILDTQYFKITWGRSPNKSRQSSQFVLTIFNF
jgi:hypothetical protein